MTDKLIIFDTTLRDGEQSPGASMTRDEKLRIARQLERLRVDVIEAGFAASSNGDFESVQAIARAVKDSTVCSLARANDRDIARAAEALKEANRARIHTFIATSALHMEKKLRMTPEQVLEQARQAVRFARNLVEDIEFSPEDGYRSDPDFLCRVIETVIAEGATTINVPDTVGYAIPELYGNFIKNLRERIPNSDKAIWSVHCHNDLGMAVANSLAGVKIGGARQVECTINGLGERAGNCSLEEVVMAVKTRRDYFGLDVGIDTQHIVAASRMVSQTTGFVVQPNKAVVGANAFAHASGIHQDGVLKSRDTYEIMDPAEVGAVGSNIVLSARSGRAALRHRLQELGYVFDDEDFAGVYDRFLEVADQKREVYDEDLESIVQDLQREVSAAYVLKSLQIQCGDPLIPNAIATIVDEAGQTHVASAIGTGPVDAAFKAIDRVVSVHGDLQEFAVKAVTRGIDAIGEVTARVRAEDGKVYVGRGSDTDIIVSSAKAYLNAINRMIDASRTQRAHVRQG